MSYFTLATMSMSSLLPNITIKCLNRKQVWDKMTAYKTRKCFIGWYDILYYNITILTVQQQITLDFQTYYTKWYTYGQLPYSEYILHICWII